MARPGTADHRGGHEGAVIPHHHCPRDCEHPQPFKRGEAMLCGRCWFVDGIETEVFLCTPATCADDVA